jgi:hypothetical protein
MCIAPRKLCLFTNYGTVRNVIERKGHAVFQKPFPVYYERHLVVTFSNEGRPCLV